MSLSNPTKTIISPVKRYFRWNGSNGTLSYYDKEKQTNVETKLPLQIIPIDQLSCVEGFNAKADKGFRSNEVKKSAEQPLVVRWNGGGIIVEGLYKNIKEKITLLGGKYHQSIYFVTMIDGKLEICNLKLKGAAMSAWLDLQKGLSSSIEGNLVTISRSEQMKTGNVPYYIPVFSIKKASEKLYNEAVRLDGELQSYFASRNSIEYSAGEFLGDDVDTTPLSEEEKTQLSKPKSKNTKSSIEIIEESQEEFFKDWE
jgi:hypothetical protein